MNTDTSEKQSERDTKSTGQTMKDVSHTAPQGAGAERVWARGYEDVPNA